MSVETVVQFLGAALTIGLTYWLSTVLNRAAARTEVSVNANRKELRMHRLYVWMGWGGCFMAGAFGFATLTSGDAELYFLGPITMLLFGGIGSWMLLNYYRHRVRWDEATFTIIDQWNQENTILWEALDAIKYEKSLGRFRVYANGQSYAISAAMVGLKAYFDKVKTMTGKRPTGNDLPNTFRDNR